MILSYVSWMQQVSSRFCWSHCEYEHVGETELTAMMQLMP